MKPSVTMPLLVAGLAIMFAGPWLVGVLLPPTAVWTDESQQARSKAGADLHAAMERGGGAVGQASRSSQPAHSPQAGHAETGQTPDYASAKAAYDEQQARHDASQSRRMWLIYGTRLLGILLAAAGIAGFALQRQQA